MKNFQLILSISFTVFCFQIAQSQIDLPFQVGYAYSVITPTDTAFIAGHSHNRVFKGINDDIYVKAITVSNTSDTMALLTFDCIGLLHPQLVEIRQLIKAKLSEFPVDKIAMTSTHTHSGPDVVGIWGKDLMHSGVDQEYLEELVQKAAETLIHAWKIRKGVKGEYAISDHGEDWVHNISEPAELDRSITVIRFTDHNNNNVATLTNFACHPTFLDAVNDKVSSDYVGGYYKTMDRDQGGGNLFLQGSIGGWVQPEFEAKTPEQAFFRGDELAIKVLDIMKTSKPLNGQLITYNSQIIKMPLENQGFRMLSEAGVIDRKLQDSVTTEIAYFTIGNAAFATHPGETVPQLSHRTKDLMYNDGPKFVIGLGMDALGYILKPYFFDPEKKVPHSPYLCSVSVGPKTQEFIYNTLKDLILGEE